jgi:hypothetical protein
MKLDLSEFVYQDNGEVIKDEKGEALTLYQFVKIGIMTQLQDDPTTLEHNRKLQLIYTKLARAKETKIIEVKNETATFIRERLLKCKTHVLVMLALERVIEGDIKDAALDTI